MGKSMVSCNFSLKPIHWYTHPKLRVHMVRKGPKCPLHPVSSLACSSDRIASATWGFFFQYCRACDIGHVSLSQISKNEGMDMILWLSLIILIWCVRFSAWLTIIVIICVQLWRWHYDWKLCWCLWARLRLVISSHYSHSWIGSSVCIPDLDRMISHAFWWYTGRIPATIRIRLQAIISTQSQGLDGCKRRKTEVSWSFLQIFPYRLTQWITSCTL